MTEALLEVEDVVRDYPLAAPHGLFQPRPTYRAVDQVSLSLAPGESLGIVGESGCGKSTLARMVMALDRPTAGHIRFQGQDLFAQGAAALRRQRRGFQMVFQDPYGSLDPRHPVGRSIAEPLSTLRPAPGRAERRSLVAAMLAEVGLAAADADKYPHQFSGGQRQRIAIARALITRPALIVADEPVSALDVSIQAQVLNLLLDLQQRHGLAYLLISHNLAVVAHVATRIAVMQAGKIVETGPTRAVLDRPQHPYTQALLGALPSLDPRRRHLV